MQKEKKSMASELVVTSIGACLAFPTGKKQSPCVMLAYMTGEQREISYLIVPLSKKDDPQTRDSLLRAIRSAEHVKNVRYADPRGVEKPIYLCRPANGRITDAVERDYEANRFVGEFCEIHQGSLRFSIGEDDTVEFRSGEAFQLNVTGVTESRYTEGSYQYAVVNAFNACLLGRLFDAEELHLQTRGKKPVRPVVRVNATEYVEEDVLWIRPVISENGEVECYMTEEFSYVDGDTVSCRAYKIIYMNRFHDYHLMRV